MAKKQKEKTGSKGIIIMVIVLVAAVLVLGLPVWGNVFDRAKGYVLKVDGAKVSVSEYKYYIAQQASMYEMYFGANNWSQSYGESTLGQTVMDSVINLVVSNKISAAKAKEMGLTLDDTDREKAQTALNDMKTYYDDATFKYIKATDAQILQYIEQDIMSEKVYNEVTKDYVVDEADFDTVFTKYIEDNYESLVKTDVDFVVIDDLEEAQEFINKVKAGEDFNKLAVTYKSDFDEREELISAELNTGNFPEEVVTAGKAMELDAVSDPIVTTDTIGTERYYVLKISGITPPDEEALRTEQRESYISGKKNEIYKAEHELWSKEYEDKIKFNTALAQTIPIKGATYKEVEQTENPEATDTPETTGTPDTTATPEVTASPAP